MERAVVQRWDNLSPPPDGIRLAVAADIVQETVRECERLLLDAEETAEQIRAAADDDASRVRRDALRSNARLLTDLEQRRPQVEAGLAAARSMADRAVELSTGLATDARRQADQVLEAAVVRAKEMVEGAEAQLAAAVVHHEAAEATRGEAAALELAADERFAQADAQHAAALQRAAEAEETMAAASARMQEADGLLAVATQVLAAAEASRQLVDARSRAVEARSVEVERRVADLHEATESAMRDLTSAALAAEVGAERIGEQAWHAAQALQREMLADADAEALEITWAASVGAAQVRREAEDEARALRLEARALADEARVLAATPLTTPAVALSPQPERLLITAPGLVWEDKPEATPDAVADPEPTRSGHRRQLLAVALLVLVAAVLVRLVVATPYSVESDSMEPTLIDGQDVLVNKLAYSLGEPGRGDVVILDFAEEALVKRVVGLPGEVVEGRDGSLLINGEVLAESYLGEAVTTSTFAPVELGPDQLYVLGDNRATSADSRVFGPVTINEVVGRVEVIVWPLGDVGRP